MDPMEVKKIKEQLLEKLIDDLDMLPMGDDESKEGEMPMQSMGQKPEMGDDEAAEGEGMPPEVMSKLKEQMMGADKGRSSLGMDDEEEIR